MTFDGINAAAGSAHADLEAVGRFIRALLSTAVTPLVLTFIYQAVQDVNRADGEVDIGTIDVLSWILIGVQIVGGAAVFRFYDRPSASLLSGSRREKFISTASGAYLALVLASAVSFVLLSAILGETSRPAAVPLVAMILSFVATSMFAYHLGRTRT